MEPQCDLFCDKGSVDEVGVMPLTMTLEHETSGWGDGATGWKEIDDAILSVGDFPQILFMLSRWRT